MGRPKKVVSTNAPEAIEAVAVMPRSRDVEKVIHPKRVPLHEQRDQLTTTSRSGFVRRWVNDVAGRVDKFLRAGYEPVQDTNVQVGEDGVTNNNIALGSGARKMVGRTREGDGTQAVLMEIPKELYEEDQKAKAAKIDAVDKVLKRSIVENDFYGSVTQTSSKDK